MPIFFDAGSQSIKVNNGKKSSSHPAVIAYTDKMLLTDEAVKELSTRHLNTVQHLPAALKVRHDVQLKHPRGEEEVSVELALAMILKKLNMSGEDTTVISVSDGLSRMEVERLRTATTAAGLKDVTFIPSTLAAAIAWSKYCVTPDTKCLVVDVGCRFTSASIVEVSKHKSKIIATRAMRMGGHDIDKLFLDFLKLSAEGTHPNVLLAAVETTKKNLAVMPEAKLELRNHVQFVNRDQLEQASKPFLEKLKTMVSQLVIEHSEVVVALLVGGAARMHSVRDVVENGGGAGRKITIEVMDPEYSSVQGCAKWQEVSSSSSELPKPRERPFAYWTRKGDEPVMVFRDSVTHTKEEEGSSFVYEHLKGIDDKEHKVSHEDLLLAHDEATPLPPQSPPLHGSLDSSDHKVTVVYKLTGQGKEIALGIGGPEGDAEVYSPLVGCSKKVRAKMDKLQEHNKMMKELEERRNDLEEATLRVECMDNPEEFEAACPDKLKYLDLANKWVKHSTVDMVLDMAQMIELVNSLVDAFEEGTESNTAELESGLDKKYFRSTAELLAELDEERTAIAKTIVSEETGIMCSLLLELAVFEEEAMRHMASTDETSVRNIIVKQMATEQDTICVEPPISSYKRVAFFALPVLFAGFLGRCWFGSGSDQA